MRSLPKDFVVPAGLMPAWAGGHRKTCSRWASARSLKQIIKYAKGQVKSDSSVLLMRRTIKWRYVTICGFMTAAIINAACWVTLTSSIPTSTITIVRCHQAGQIHCRESFCCPCAEHLIAQLRGDAAGLIKPVVHTRQDLKPSQCIDSAALSSGQAMLEIGGLSGPNRGTARPVRHEEVSCNSI